MPNDMICPACRAKLIMNDTCDGWYCLHCHWNGSTVDYVYEWDMRRHAPWL